MPLALVLFTGLVAGVTHVVTGIDHLAALLPLSVGRRARAFALGARWGVGHSAGVVIVAACAVALRHRLDVVAASAHAEGLVGVMLIAIGLLGLRTAVGVSIHAHPHAHAQSDHVHLHMHARSVLDAHDAALHRHSHAALAAGTLHGVAGTAHVLGVLPAVALPDAASSGAYLAAFATGTILAMGGFAALVGAISSRAGRGTPRLLQRMMYAASVGALLVGAAWLILPLLDRIIPSVHAQASDPARADLAGRIALVPPSGQKVGPGGTVIWLPGLERQAASATPATIASRNKRFEPHVLAVLRGTSVAFPNTDPIYHNAFSLSPGNPFDLGLYRKGASRSVKLDATGLVRVYCNIHPDMAAYVMVVDGAFAVVGDDGAYRIRGVPAGRHAVRLWNEMAGEQTATFDFRAGRATDWSPTLDGSQYRSTRHKNKHGKDYPPATKDADRY